MSEDIKDEDVVEDVEAVEEGYTEEEQQAMEHGWAPKDAWKGNPEDWVNARAFIKRGELFGKIRSLERNTDQLKQQFKQATTAMRDMLKKARETEYNRAVKELKERKKAALEEGEVSAILGIDDDIEELRTEYSKDAQEMQAMEATTAQAAPEPSQEFIQWQARNTWYDDDPGMRITADQIGVRIAQENPNASLSDVFKEVDKQIRRIYPDKFNSKQRVSKVSDGDTRTSSGSGGKKSKYTERDLNPQQRQIMDTMTKSGVMTKAEYIEELARIGEIGG